MSQDSEAEELENAPFTRGAVENATSPSNGFEKPPPGTPGSREHPSGHSRALLQKQLSTGTLDKHLISAVVATAQNDMDFLLTNLGFPGRYQILLFAALISCMIPVVFSDLCSIFYIISPTDVVCDTNETIRGFPVTFHAVPPNGSFLDESRNSSYSVFSANDSCINYDVHVSKCRGNLRYMFADYWVRSIVSEWDLLCHDIWLVNFSITVYFLGVMLGSIAYGHLADRFGRRKCIISCYLGYLPLSIGLAFVQSYWLFAVFRFFIGFFIQGLQSVCFVLLMEYCAPRYREIIGGLEGVVANFGIMMLSGIAYWLGNWRTIQLCIALPTVLALSKFLFVRESLRWQMVRGDFQEAKQTVAKILRWNKMDDRAQLEHVLGEIGDVLRAQENLEEAYTWLDCFRTPNMRRYTLVQCFMWFTALFVYYGISFSIESLDGNIYINTFAASFAEIPAAFIAMYLMHKYGRRKPLFFYKISCGIFCIIAGFLSFIDPFVSHSAGFDVGLIRTITVFVGRFFIAGAFGVLFVYGSELFPTVLRNTAFGICLACHTSGGVVAPQVLLLGELVHESVPFFIFAACCILSGALVLLLPETWKRKMPDTIEEVEGKDTSNRVADANSVL